VRLVAMRFALLGLEEVQLEEATVTGVPEHVLVWTRVTWQEVRAGSLHFLQGLRSMSIVGARHGQRRATRCACCGVSNDRPRPCTPAGLSAF
jgi:hypothetical protein